MKNIIIASSTQDHQQLVQIDVNRLSEKDHFYLLPEEEGPT